MTPEGRRLLGVQIGELKLALNTSVSETSDRGARSNGNTSGGCPIPDGVTSNHELQRAQITRFTRQFNEAQIVQMPTTREIVSIGHVITLQYWKLFERRVQYQIVGYNEGDCDSTPRRISYETDLAQVFLEQSVGFIIPVRIDGKVRMTKLTAIRLITDKGVIRNPEPESLAA